MEEQFTVAVLGATGRVGREMLAVLAERRFPVRKLRALASARSAGQTVSFDGQPVVVEDVEQAELKGIDVALFSAGGGTSRQWAPRFVEAGAVVIDNSSAWRMDPDVPLVVPEVNREVLSATPRIIANPNCSTIQLVLVLAGFEHGWGIERVNVATYQAVSGAGEKGVREYLAQRDQGSTETSVMGQLVFENVVPWIGGLGADGATEEEIKVTQETRKILGLPELAVNCIAAVRVPVVNAHSEAVNIVLKQSALLDDIHQMLAGLPGVQLLDDPAARRFPTPREVSGEDDVFVGRVRPDRTVDQGWNLWIVGDNIRKGAALNAVQIAETLVYAP